MVVRCRHLVHIAMLLCIINADSPDPTCSRGIPADGACCVKSCGRCGGKGCGKLPGGADQCCGSHIIKNDPSCDTHGPPCKMSPGPAPGAKCTLQNGIEYIGNDVASPQPTIDEAACCASCLTDKLCKFFTYEGGSNGLCHHKNTDAPDYSRHNASCTSGYPGVAPPSPDAPTNVSIRLGGLVSEGGANHVCWNIDASANRGFFWRNLVRGDQKNINTRARSNDTPQRIPKPCPSPDLAHISQSAGDPSSYGAQLARQASALGEAQEAGYSLLRFGGSGNDYLTYQFGGHSCPQASSTKQCLNETHWAALLSFTKQATAKMIFGLSMNTGRDMGTKNGPGDYPYPWDPTNARQILQWTIDHQLDHLLFGFELGNEQNNKYTGKQQAHNFAVLHNLTVDLWPDPSKRPVLLGPDPHSLHSASGSQLQWIGDWLDGCRALGVPIYGVTHHEYVEVDPTPSGFVSAQTLALNGAIAAAINRTVRQHDPDVKIFGGEIGPHNGGSPPCDHTSMRWAVFGDSLWYADALAAKAMHGYAGLCRQDFIGADYGMLDCLTGAPLPDYFTALLWTRTMGPRVLAVTATSTTHRPLPPDTSSVRVYAHCATGEAGQAGGVTLLAINLGNRSTTLHRGSASAGDVQAYVLTPSQDPASSLTPQGGLMGTGVMLNGQLLKLGAGGQVPATPPTTIAGADTPLVVPPTSIAFFVVPGAKHQDCAA